MAFFAALDTTVKYVSAFLPLITTLWVRFVFQSLITAGMLLPSRGRAVWRVNRFGALALRGVLMALSSAVAFMGLKFMPVAEFTAVMMLTPMMITLVSAYLLREGVSWQRWLLLVGALVGALLVIQPGATHFGWAMLLPVLLIALNVAYQLLTRHQPPMCRPAACTCIREFSQ